MSTYLCSSGSVSTQPEETCDGTLRRARASAPLRLEPRPHPGGEGGLVDAALGKAEHRFVCTRIVRGNLGTVQLDEGFRDHPGCPLVAVDDGMVARNAASVGRREIGEVGRSVGEQVLRPRQRGLQETHVPHAIGATVLGELFLVDGQDDIGLDPGVVHSYFASSRSSVRRFFMTLRAMVILRSNSGS